MIQIEVNLDTMLALLAKYYEWDIKENDPDKGIPTWSIHVTDTVKEIEFIWIAAGPKPQLPTTIEKVLVWMKGYQYGRSVRMAAFKEEVKDEA